MGITEALQKQFETMRVVEISGTIDVAHVWQCKRCLIEISFVRYHPDHARVPYSVDVAQELRDHLQFDCHVKLCPCGHKRRDHHRVSGLSPSACDWCRCARFEG